MHADATNQMQQITHDPAKAAQVSAEEERYLLDAVLSTGGPSAIST